jgi:triosephosphate isomerase
MRIPIVAGNWKMNTSVAEAISRVEDMKEALERIEGVEKVICPPFISLFPLSKLLSESSIKLGAQNVYFEEKGAFTGEISPLMLKGLCTYVILGHSERRRYFGEDDELINQKVGAVVKAGLLPILCVGESLTERKKGRTDEVVGRQLKIALEGINFFPGLVIAYEPIWAIGTGVAAHPEEADDTCGFIRRLLGELYGDEGRKARIQYGGSVTEDNISSFAQKENIDGALVGGASLKAEEFSHIVQKVAQVKGVR